MTSRNEMFAAEPRHYIMKDLVIVALTAGLTLGFVVHSLHPAGKASPRAIAPAVCLAQR